MRYLTIFILFISFNCFSQLELFSVYQESDEDNVRLKAGRASSDTLILPFYENFSSLSYNDVWQENNGVYLNNHYAENQPSVGVLTLDGIDGTGEPYFFSSDRSTTVGIGDYITSECINLSSLNSDDGLAFSFFWEQGTPYDPNRDPLWEDGERLRLYFKDSTESFVQVWPNDEIINRINATGLTADTFYLENVLLDERYIHEGFQFKFEYYGTLRGNYGIFNVDNIYLDKGVATVGADTTFKTPIDYAISHTPRTFLNEYSSVPFQHFLEADETIIDDSIFTSVYTLGELFITDTDSSIRIIDEGDQNVILSTGSDEFNFFDSIVPGEPIDIYWTLDQASIKAGIDATIADEMKIFKTLISVTTTDTIVETDSASSVTILSDYYAYDDGSMEAGLGIRGVGEFVQAFDFIKSDTLKGFYVYFPKNGLDLSNTFFTYKIYETLEGIDGATEDELLYEQGDVVQYYTDESDSSSLNKYLYVPLSQEQLIGSGRYYFGIEQDTEYMILLGVDYSIDRSEQIYYRSFTDPWSSFKDNGGVGTVALRPVVGSDNFTESDDEEDEEEVVARVSPSYMSPNPGNGVFQFETLVDDITIFTTSGYQIYSQTINAESVDLSFLDQGLYLVHLQSGNSVNTVRLLID